MKRSSLWHHRGTMPETLSRQKSPFFFPPSQGGRWRASAQSYSCRTPAEGFLQDTKLHCEQTCPLAASCISAMCLAWACLASDSTWLVSWLLQHADYPRCPPGDTSWRSWNISRNHQWMILNSIPSSPQQLKLDSSSSSSSSSISSLQSSNRVCFQCNEHVKVLYST